MDSETNFDQKYYLSVHTLTSKQPSIVSLCDLFILLTFERMQ